VRRKVSIPPLFLSFPRSPDCPTTNQAMRAVTSPRRHAPAPPFPCFPQSEPVSTLPQPSTSINPPFYFVQAHAEPHPVSLSRRLVPHRPHTHTHSLSLSLPFPFPCASSVPFGNADPHRMTNLRTHTSADLRSMLHWSARTSIHQDHLPDG
jgi:hypothetical protein